MSFWDALAGAAEGFGAAWDFKTKTELAERMEKEREARAEQRQIDKEQRQEQKELRTPDPARDQADPERGVIKLFNKNGDPLGEIPMSEHQREGIQLGRQAERVSLDNLVTTGDINRTRLEYMPLEFGMKQEAHRSRLNTDADRRVEANARADAARARSAGEAAGLEGELAGPTAEAIQDTIDSALSMSGVDRMDAPDVYDLALRAVEAATNQRQKGRRIDPAVTLSTWLTNKYGDKPLSRPTSSSSSSSREW